MADPASESKWWLAESPQFRGCVAENSDFTGPTGGQTLPPRMTPRESRTTPTGIKAPHGATVFQISWADGTVHHLPHRILRGYCPCAGCQGHGGGIRFHDAGAPDLLKLQQVGNYALELEWSDRHATGIYTFPYLRQLGELHAVHGDALPETLPEI
jgi:DUF971 family protein